MTTSHPVGKPRSRRRAVGYFAGIATAAALLLAAAHPASGHTTQHETATLMPSHEHHELNGNDVVFGPAPDVFPPGAEMAVLQGDPSVAGAIFTIRLRLPDGYVVPPHWHPTDENVTVIQGTFLIGIGDTVDKHALLPPLHRGGFATAPATVHHFAIAKGQTIVQVHALGPFQMTYVNPADDPRSTR